MTEIEALNIRVRALEKMAVLASDLNSARSTNEIMDQAARTAIHSIVQELAVKAGISDEEFLKHYAIRFRWWHDHLLQRAENESPAEAARLDVRSLAQADVPEAYPSIFDPPPEGSLE